MNYSSTYMVHTKLTAKSLEKHSQQVRETYLNCIINEHVIGKVLYAFNHLLGLELIAVLYGIDQSVF